MKLSFSRSVIATILMIVMALSTAVFMISLIMTFTAGDQKYFINHFANDALVSECNAQLNMKYEALSNETGIPARVFERVKADFPTDEAIRQAALSVFSEENETLYSENKVNYFYELSMEYLDGNDCVYNKQDIKRAAEKAARIYSDTVGLHNTSGIEARISSFASKFPKATIVSFVLAFACFPSIMVMYKRKKEGYFNAIGGIFAGSAATSLGSLLIIIFNPASSFNILPAIHNQSIVSTTARGFMIILFFSAIVCATSLSFMRVVDKKIQDED